MPELDYFGPQAVKSLGNRGLGGNSNHGGVGAGVSCTVLVNGLKSDRFGLKWCRCPQAAIFPQQGLDRFQEILTLKVSPTERPFLPPTTDP
jgi:hypothetical protein